MECPGGEVTHKFPQGEIFDSLSQRCPRGEILLSQRCPGGEIILGCPVGEICVAQWCPGGEIWVPRDAQDVKFVDPRGA